MSADLVPEVFALEMGGHVAPRADYTHPAAACEAMTGDTERWASVRRRWAVRYTASGEDEPCYGEGECFSSGGCGCFEVRDWPAVKRISPDHRQPIWWLP